MQIKKIFLFILLLSANVCVFGQTTDKGVVPSTKTITPKAETVVEETIDGVWELTGYLGKKLMNEMGNRMNLGESNPSENKKTKRVTIKVGPFKIERIESGT
ncbi:hypothetical protein G3O08_07610 [Cryomorpha ignava]|uniref:Uncharacterized protein n=1 Tax=Cryomorpha ignava TaxID=101383 RepID=A0A7K3WPC7_9FLAO|nr:hypothetical protein [Cryomorpha ignava]NEN23364.1 hypothetical protein [Cryomorpha ignava]